MTLNETEKYLYDAITEAISQGNIEVDWVDEDMVYEYYDSCKEIIENILELPIKEQQVDFDKIARDLLEDKKGEKNENQSE